MEQDIQRIGIGNIKFPAVNEEVVMEPELVWTFDSETITFDSEIRTFDEEKI